MPKNYYGVVSIILIGATQFNLYSDRAFEYVFVFATNEAVGRIYVMFYVAVTYAFRDKCLFSSCGF